MSEIDRVFAHIQTLLLQTWRETGFGSLAIESERINQKDKIRVIIKGSTHYRYVISAEDVVQIENTDK